MAASSLVLVAGILLGFADQAFGVRNSQGPMDTLRQRWEHAWCERRLTLAGAALMLVAAVLAWPAPGPLVVLLRRLLRACRSGALCAAAFTLAVWMGVVMSGLEVRLRPAAS